MNYNRQVTNQILFEVTFADIMKYSVYELELFLDRHKGKSYDTLLMNVDFVFKSIGKLDLPIKEKSRLVHKAQLCFDDFCDRTYTNLAVIESIKINSEVNERFIRNYGILDTKIDGVDLVIWLHDKKNFELLDIFIRNFKLQLEYLMFKLNLMKIRHAVIEYIEDKSVIGSVQKSQGQILQSVSLVTEYAVVSAISSDEIIELSINDMAVEKYLETGSNFIYKISLKTNRNLIDDNIMDTFNDVVQVCIRTNIETYKYHLPIFFEGAMGINYLQRYSYSDCIGHFEYNIKAIQSKLFDCLEFEAVIKAKLDKPLDEPLTPEDVKKLRYLNLVFDDKYPLYSLDDIKNYLCMFTNLKECRMYFASQYTVQVDLKMFKNMQHLRKISVIGKNIEIANTHGLNSYSFNTRLENNNYIETCILFSTTSKVKFKKI